jgi:hypothetical protein
MIPNAPQPSSGSSSFKKWAYALFAFCFMFVWLSGMTAGLTAGACRKDRYQGEKKLRYCNISLAAGFLSDLSSIDRAKGSILHLERGIALSQLGRDVEARIEFEQAIVDAASKNGPWIDNLIVRMSQFEGTHAYALFKQVARNKGS